MSDDPGGVFASDQHRRVLGHLSLPSDDFGYNVDEFVERISGDEHLDVDDVEEYLKDLEADGHATNTKTRGWQMTKAGLKALNE